MGDWPSSQREATHEELAFIPDTPSPVFNRTFKPLKKKRENCSNKHEDEKPSSSSGQDGQSNYRELKRQSALDKLKAVRQKKKPHSNEHYQNGVNISSSMRSPPDKASKSRPAFLWPSDSESDSEPGQEQSPAFCLSDDDSEGEGTLQSFISIRGDNEHGGRDRPCDQPRKRNGYVRDIDMLDDCDDVAVERTHSKAQRASLSPDDNCSKNTRCPDTPCLPLRKRLKLGSAVDQDSERKSGSSASYTDEEMPRGNHEPSSTSPKKRSPHRKGTSPVAFQNNSSITSRPHHDFISAKQKLEKNNHTSRHKQNNEKHNSIIMKTSPNKVPFRANGASSGKRQHGTSSSATNSRIYSDTEDSCQSTALDHESCVFHTRMSPDNPSWKSLPTSSFTAVQSRNSQFSQYGGSSSVESQLRVSPKKFYMASSSPGKSHQGKGKTSKNTTEVGSKVKGKSRSKQQTSSSPQKDKSRAASKRHRSSTSTTHHSLTIDSDSDGDSVVVVNQLETDEAMARLLQEEMDRDYALMLTHSDSPHRPSSHQPARGRGHYGSNPHLPVGGPYGPGMFVEYDGSNQEEAYLRMMAAAAGPSDSDDEQLLQDFPFMAAGRSGQNPLDLLTAGVLEYQLHRQNQRRVGATRRSQTRGRTGRRNAIAGAGSPAVSGDDYEALLDLAERLGEVKQKGLTKNQINCLPVKKFKPSEGGSSSQNKECLVCMSDYEEGDSVRILTCFHDFHVTCIDKWLKKNNTCPICRVEVKL